MNRENNRHILTDIALADHMGDVNDCLPQLADALGEARPEWNYEWDRYVFPWEDEEQKGLE